jgi:protein involved in polysaccharide export with SLBB domain
MIAALMRLHVVGEFQMRNQKLTVTAVLAWALSIVPVVAAQGSIQPQPGEAQADYRLQRGDVLLVRLFYNPDLNEQLPIRPDGKISLALVGEVDAAGLTPGELSKVLTERFSRSLRQSDTVVIVKEFAGQRVYIGGEVNQPGIVRVPGPINVLQGILEAGGFRRGAKLDSVVILRDQGTPQPLFMSVNLKDQLADGRTSDPVMLRAGDIVYVPQTRITRVAEFMTHNIRELTPVALSLGVSYVLGNPFVR